MSLLSKIGIWISIGVFSLSAPMNSYAMYMEGWSYSIDLDYRITDIQDPGKSISPLDGSIPKITVYTQTNAVIHVINWLESQQTGCHMDQDGFLVFQGQQLINNSNLICDIIDNKEEYLSFLQELRDNKGYKMTNKVTLGGIGLLMEYSSDKKSMIPYTNAPLISKRAPNKQWVLGIEKEFGWDSPWYSIVRVFVQDGMIVYQQAEIIPYSVLHGGEGTNLEQFDSNLKKAANRGWKFSSKSFQLRYVGLMKQFNKEWQLMQ